ncbi:MAG: Flp pilus assembly complex ATPase component TadA [Lachnospiraceae bacterium]|nr:Flp pilus assembly complex ATPase component TadA [Lachnospiraceae bacterium]
MIEELLKLAQDAKASDIHLAPDHPVMFRINGTLCEAAGEVSAEEVDRFLHTVLSRAQWSALEKDGETEAAVTCSEAFRIRIYAYRQQGRYAAAVRLLSLDVPGGRELGIPDAVMGFAGMNRGLVLLTGEAGSGRTTTAASLLQEIAGTKAKHIVTIEHPVEYLLSKGNSLISQREIGTDAGSYAKAIQAAVRQDADVLFVSELPDAEAVWEAILAAEAGVLVIVLLSDGRIEDALRQLIDVFPAHRKELVQTLLSKVFAGASAQQLLPCMDGAGRALLSEVLLADKEVQLMIREGRLALLTSVMEQKKHNGMQTMDDAILSAYMKSVISAETAAAYAQEPEQMRRKMKIY